jgi:hypothetical protein
MTRRRVIYKIPRVKTTKKLLDKWKKLSHEEKMKYNGFEGFKSNIGMRNKI